jgi:antitoxin (DNA-binding transcriptional repressor) of toxin-antitoxin stability system
MLQFPMTTITLEDIQRDVAGYLHRVQSGETLLVMEADAPLAEIKPARTTNAGGKPLRPVGLCAGEFVVPDDFDAPLPKK